jgi:hypothetical protein
MKIIAHRGNLSGPNPMKDQLPILSNDLLPDYLEKVSNGLKEAFDALKDAEISTDAFSFYTSVASVFSSKIEGEAIELDSYSTKSSALSFLQITPKK